VRLPELVLTDAQHHMPVLPNVQVELEAAYRKTIPQAKK
jgi:hypothetical protein